MYFLFKAMLLGFSNTRRYMQCNAMSSVYDDGDRDVNIDDVT